MVKSAKPSDLRMGDEGRCCWEMVRWWGGLCDNPGPESDRCGCRCDTANGGREVIVGRYTEAPCLSLRGGHCCCRWQEVKV